MNRYDVRLVRGSPTEDEMTAVIKAIELSLDRVRATGPEPAPWVGSGSYRAPTSWRGAEMVPNPRRDFSRKRSR
ncbi:hypothetical protein [Actinopolyspora mortivallis]|uniref:Uncharacterized protein n=1 Tax=Actinopolyspora mortivallis TaxID=33906 RepID=A0A2T0GWZ4_ACTMO|nr:hypothetical protein [Actinopolyspora mortivallis]PRW63630.1 hypothetical protein CEP50_09190 [Actinopolyspora mortivallis]